MEMETEKMGGGKSNKNVWIWVLVIVVIAIVWWLVSGTSAPVVNEGEEGVMAGEYAGEMSYIRGIEISVDGENYYFDGPADAENGGKDIPGHAWADLGGGKLAGLHYNTGPSGAAQWWSSDAPDGELLYKVDAVVDGWTKEKAQSYADDGFVHYHELVRVSDGQLHPSKVVWLKHIAQTSFTLDGGPGAPNPPYEHAVSPGVDPLFPPNGMTPYSP